MARAPDNPVLLYEYARVQRNLGEHEQARQTLEAVLSKHPNWVEAVVERGLVELDLRQTEAAGRRLRQAEQLSPKHRAVLFALVEYLRQTGEKEELQRYQARIEEVEAEVRQRVEAALQEQARLKQRKTAPTSSP